MLRGTGEQLDIGSLAAAIDRGATFLARHQRPDGSFRGFFLFPGASSSWISAHVGFVAERVPVLEPVRQRIGDFLAVLGPDRGGWGYNERVGIDCDSTAQALLVLHSLGRTVPGFLVKRLADAQGLCGGFPTYPPIPKGAPPANGWQCSHAEVTALVVAALRNCEGFRKQVRHAETWLADQLSEEGLSSYWWQGAAYGLWVQHRIGLHTQQASKIARRLLPSSSGVPELPLLLASAIEEGGMAAEVVNGIACLLSLQRADGSWPCDRCLRVTDPGDTLGGPVARGRVHRDRRRIFSTVHAVAALEQARAAAVLAV